MRHEIKTFRFTCDGWYYKGGNKWEPTECPNTFLLNGTEEEINRMFESSGWRHVEVPVAQTAIEKHVCPRKHGQDSLREPREPLFIDETSKS